jgi:hypothetical protein
MAALAGPMVRDAQALDRAAQLTPGRVRQFHQRPQLFQAGQQGGRTNLVRRQSGPALGGVAQYGDGWIGFAAARRRPGGLQKREACSGYGGLNQSGEDELLTVNSEDRKAWVPASNKKVSRREPAPGTTVCGSLERGGRRPLHNRTRR